MGTEVGGYHLKLDVQNHATAKPASPHKYGKSESTAEKAREKGEFYVGFKPPPPNCFSASLLLFLFCNGASKTTGGQVQCKGRPTQPPKLTAL